MRISLQCMGGFTGPAGAQTRTVDLDRLPQAECARLHAQLHALDLATLPPALMKPRPQPWDFVYTLKIENGACRQLRFQLDAAPPAVHALVDTLEQYPPD